jgi:O-antigen/teichoic acid export membrane protein
MSEGNLRKIARNAGISASGTFITLLTAPLTAIITTRALGPELYGIYTLANYWTSLLADVSRLGFGGSLIRFTAVYRGEGREDKIKGAFLLSMKVALVAGTVLTAGLIVFAGPFCSLVLKRPDVAPAFRFFAPAIVLTALYGGFIASLTGFQEQKYVVLSNNILGSLVKIVTLVLLLFFGLRLYAALASSLLQDAAILVFGAYFLLKVFPGLRDRALLPVTEGKTLWKFAGTLFATGIFNKHARQMDLLFLGMFRPLHEVGLYAVAQRLQPLIYMPHYAIMQIFGPVTAELYSRGETGEMKDLYKTVTKWTATFSIPIFLTIVLFYGPILAIFGRDYQGAAAALLILGVGNAVTDVFGMSGQVITMIGRPAVNLANSVVVAVVSVGLYLYLIPRYGIVGAASAYAVSQVTVNAVRVLQVRWLAGMSPFKKSLWKTAASALAAFAAVDLARRGGVIDGFAGAWVVELVLLWAVYALATWRLGLDVEDMVVVDALKRKIFG